MGTIPPLIGPGLIGKACGISRRAALTLLSGAGILERNGGRWKVGESRLRERLPDVYDRVYAFVVLGPETVDQTTGNDS
jgi:hypothetical protein